MVSLDNSTKQELLAVLSPLLEHPENRRQVLASALGGDCPALNPIQWGGAAEPFILRVVAELSRFGAIESGKQALWKLLEVARERVGKDLRARIDSLERIVNREDALS